MKLTSKTHRRGLGIIAAVCCVVAMPSMVSAAGKPSKGQVYACVNAQTGDILRVLADETARCAKKEHLVMMYPTTNSGSATSGSTARPTTTTVACDPNPPTGGSAKGALPPCPKGEPTTTIAGACDPNPPTGGSARSVLPPCPKGEPTNPTTTVAPVVLVQTGFVLLPGITLTLPTTVSAGDLVASIRADLNQTGASSIVLRVTNKGPGRVAGPALAVIVVPRSVKTSNCTDSVWSSGNADVYSPVAVSQQYGGPIASCKVPVSLNLDSGQSFDVPFNVPTSVGRNGEFVVVGGGIFRSEAPGAAAIDLTSANNVATPTLALVSSDGVETFADSNVDGHLRLTVTRGSGGPCCRVGYGIKLENVGSQILQGPLSIRYTVNAGPAPQSTSGIQCIGSVDSSLIFRGGVQGNDCLGTLLKFADNTPIVNRPGRVPVEAYIEPRGVPTIDFTHSATVTATVGSSSVSVTISGARTLGTFSEVAEN